MAKLILSRATMARGVVVLDENVGGLEPALREANILVIKPSDEISDDEIKAILLPHRIFVTNNPEDFILDAPAYEYGIIALNKLKFIDPSPTYRTNKTVQLISKAMSQYTLWVRGARFLLELREDGKHTLEELS